MVVMFMRKIIEYDLLEKNMGIDDIVSAESFINISDYKLTYWEFLYKAHTQISNEKFHNMRYYYLNINRLLYKISIPFINMFYYKKSFDSVPIENRNFRKPEIDYFEELYFFYFFSVIELIFVVINKCFVLINECLELGINNKQNSSFETSIANALRNNENINNLSEIKDLEKYISNYKGSIFDVCKRNYRNLYVHDFTGEIPKYKSNDSTNFEIDIKMEDSFADCIALLKELDSFLKLIDKVVIKFIT